MIAANVGPMQGVQPIPSAMPSRGALSRPRLPRKRGRSVRCARVNAPMNTKPRTMTTTPSTRVRMFAYSRKNSPATPPSTVTVMNTSVNPATNNATPPSSRPRPAAWVCVAEVDREDPR